MSDCNPALDVFNEPLQSGIHLIEASAGTGKTYSIVMLVARFIVEQGVPLENILVVTFTRAATRELKERLRERLLEIRASLRGESSDPELDDWCTRLPDRSQAAQRIHQAMEDMDYASVFTIHGFAQRVLKQYALESGQLFDVELQEDIGSIERQIAEDFWRIHTYDASPERVQIYTRLVSTPDELLKAVDKIEPGHIIRPDIGELAPLQQAFDQALQKLPDLIAKIVAPLLEANQQHPTAFNNSLKTENLLELRKTLDAWQSGESVRIPFKELECISREGSIYEGIAKRKYKTEEQQDRFLDECGVDTSAVDELLDLALKNKLGFKMAFFQYLQDERETRLQQANVMSYDQIITRLAEVLQREQSDSLAEALTRQYPVALIDEFQDTDRHQWTIFKRLFGAQSSTLYLIGDPKQSIYAFRGADIHTYMLARDSAHRSYHLDTNWRSHDRLITAVNQLFSHSPSPFMMEGMVFQAVRSAEKNRADVLKDEQERSLHRLCMLELPANPGRKDGYWLHGTQKSIAARIQARVLNEVVELIGGDYIVAHDQQSRAIKPSDIAILLRSNRAAQDYQQQLRLRGVPAVLNSRDSVFESAEAREIFYVLGAVVNPTTMSLARHALTLPWFGLDIREYAQHYIDGKALDEWMLQLQRANEQWQSQGLIAMMQTLMDECEVVRHLAGYADVERRLTNIQHILELLQEAALTERLSISQTLDHLTELLNGSKEQGDRELRLESDEEAVKIVTVHSSKGLEYPIVFCPDLWQKIDLNRQQKNFSAIIKGERITDIGSSQQDELKQAVLEREQQEALRLLYVAITRAKHRCYVAYADFRTAKEPNNSALGWLISAFGGVDMHEKIKNLCQSAADCFEHSMLELEPVSQGNYRHQQQANDLSARQLTRELHVDWVMSSYSGLASHEQHVVLPELPMQKADENESPAMPDQATDGLPGGAHTGNVVHELLEHQSFAQLAAREFGDDYSQRRDELCRRYGLHLHRPELLEELLHRTVTTPLSDAGDFCLGDLQERQCLKEMPFYLSVDELDVQHLNELLADSPVCQPLTRKQLSGQLTGFIDLICEYQGRYYVMDYKTNTLEDYSPQQMQHAMYEHNYGLQYWLYSLVLHHHLQRHLPDYDFGQHFGGVRYLFVRGMDPDQPASGVYVDRPDREIIRALDAVFS